MWRRAPPSGKSGHLGFVGGDFASNDGVSHRVARLRGNLFLTAKIHSPDVNAHRSIERSQRVADRIEAPGFPVEKRLGDAKESPSGFVIQYFALVSGALRMS